METVIIVIHLMVVLALVGVVLLQRSEGGGLGIGGGSGFMTARGASNALTRATAILAAAFFATSLLLTMNMAATLFRLTVDECLAGVTREAARALCRLEQTGTLEAGKSADLAIWDIGQPAELVYRMGFNPLHARVWRGL